MRLRMTITLVQTRSSPAEARRTMSVQYVIEPQSRRPVDVLDTSKAYARKKVHKMNRMKTSDSSPSR
jgi:hypothetical protein